MKFRLVFLILLSVSIVSQSFSQLQSRTQGYDDERVAQQYVNWAKQMIDEGRWKEALAGLERAADFSNVSSDISWQLAFVRYREGKSRISVIEALDRAIEVNRWVMYNENQALLLKAEQLVAMRKYSSALSILEDSIENADAVCLRLLSLKGLFSGTGTSASNPAASLELFRRLMLSAMDRFPRDTRLLRIFFQYARNRYPEPSKLQQSDMNLLDLALRRLPFLLEADPELAWMAAPFMRNAEDARRLLEYYRTGGIPNVHNRDFMPDQNSIPASLNLGLLNDSSAVAELFSGARGFNSPVPFGIEAAGDSVLDLNVVTEVYSLLRTEEGRDMFMYYLHNFSGCIFSDDDNDGNIDSIVYYRSGVIQEYLLDLDQCRVYELKIKFSSGIPASSEYLVLGQASFAKIIWERYPYVEQAAFEEEQFNFRPADFQYAPVSFAALGGSKNYAGFTYPVLSRQFELTRRTLVSFCVSLTRASAEFDGAVEKIFFEKAFPVQAFEKLEEKYISFTEFERGFPVIQYLDMDLDGRMETIRRFHRPGPDYPWPDPDEKFDYRTLIASSESDWTGEGRYKTGELYLQDGSVVYLWDMDGSGVMDYSETETRNQ